MIFSPPNLYFCNGEFWISFALVSFIIIAFSAVCLVINISRAKSIKVMGFTPKLTLINTFVYASTIPIYYFSNQIGSNANSFIYKLAKSLNSIEIIVVMTLIIILLFGVSIKNKQKFMILFLKALANIEIIYIFSYYITKQVTLTHWYNWLGVVLLGIVYVFLNSISINPIKKNRTKINIHNPVDEYESLYALRKSQADELIDIIKNDTCISGYSVCISSKWGMGKTSFVNGIINNLRNNKDNGINIHVIHINAMELDDTTSLINYFFKRVESILKEHNIYTGIASEYSELIASISGIIINENLSGFITKKLFTHNTDYRTNVDNLSGLLSSHLDSTRIIIVIDDIDRCSAEKSKSFLFFMKEIATMSHCITMFLVDIDELKEICELDYDFFDKFFNHIISLVSIQHEEILAALIDTNPQLTPISQEIKKILERLDGNIQKAREDLSNAKNTTAPLDDLKENVSLAEKQKDAFLNDLANSRSINKVTEKYLRLRQSIDVQVKTHPERESEITLFLNKVGYQQQLTLLSIMYGLYYNEFCSIQRDSVYTYIDNLRTQFRSKFSDMEASSYRVNSLLLGEWYSLSFLSEPRFEMQEALRFVNCILTDINELQNIANGYTSSEEKNIALIEKKVLPDNMNLSDLVQMIYHATYNDIAKRKNLIKKTFVLYARQMNKNHFDPAFDLFSHNFGQNEFSHDIDFLQMFKKKFCTSNTTISNSEKVMLQFFSFTRAYLWGVTNILNRYLMPLSIIEKATPEMWNDAGIIVLKGDNCEDMLSPYCRICRSYLGLVDLEFSKPSFAALQEIMNWANKKYIDYKMQTDPDVIFAFENAKRISDEIKYLFQIESFINKQTPSHKKIYFDPKTLSIESLPSSIKGLNKHLLYSRDETQSNDYIKILLEFIYQEDKPCITVDEYELLNTIVSNFFTSYSRGVVYFRQLLISIKRNKIKTSIHSD